MPQNAFVPFYPPPPPPPYGGIKTMMLLTILEYYVLRLTFATSSMTRYYFTMLKLSHVEFLCLPDSARS